MFPRPISHSPRRSGTGFSLVEIMVGLTIGMLGLAIMAQVFALAEGQKRTTTGGADAQTNGAIALYALQHDIRLAGHGGTDLKLFECSVLLRAGVTLSAMAPVVINSASIPAGDANTDTLLVVYGNTNGSPQGDGVTSQPSTAIFAVQTPTSFAVNDRVIATLQNRPTPCALTLDQVANVASPNVTVATGAAGMSNGTLFNLGQTPKILAYAVRGGNLTQCDYMVNDCSNAASTGNEAIWVPTDSNIVSMKAQYGRDTSVPMDAIVDVYDQTTPASACGWAMVSAVRLALVARNALYEKTAVTATAPTWVGTATDPVVLTANADWQNYRYKVLQTVAPIRNVAWMGAQAGC